LSYTAQGKVHYKQTNKHKFEIWTVGAAACAWVMYAVLGS